MGSQQVRRILGSDLLNTDDSRPLQGNIKAETAINTLGVYDSRLSRLSEDYDLVCRAKEALDLEHSRDDRLQPVTEELRDLKAVWTALSGVWARLGQLREITWSAVQASLTLTIKFRSLRPATQGST
jgi:dynein heavy chain 1